eukprot:2982709-Rhodomonas_salina.1
MRERSVGHRQRRRRTRRAREPQLVAVLVQHAHDARGRRAVDHDLRLQWKGRGSTSFGCRDNSSARCDISDQSSHTACFGAERRLPLPALLFGVAFELQVAALAQLKDIADQYNLPLHETIHKKLIDSQLCMV